MATSQHVPIANLVDHAEVLDADTPLALAQPEFARRKRPFLGVVAEGRFVGVVNGSEISQSLGSQFGHALFGRAVVRNHTMPNALIVTPDTPLTELLTLASGRNDADFFTDIAVVAADLTFVGLIPIHRVVRLQTSLLLENLAEVQDKSRELAARNRQMEDDLRMAREIQLAILPNKTLCLEHAELMLTTRHFYQSSDQIGGDYFTVLQPAPDKLGLFICDVMGHGVRSALITTMVSAMLREAHDATLDPGRLLTNLNRGLQGILQSVGELIFVTAAYAVIDLARNEIDYAQAGHPPAFLWRSKEGASAPVPLLPEAEGPALGLIDGMVYVTANFAFSPGDALMMYTDGVVEATAADGAEFGMDRVQQAFDRAIMAHEPDVATCVAETSRVHAAQNHFSDDVCVLVAHLQLKR
jgi:serine phosphatase RsbU (regulator of sigma subunit)